jgi:uncharacterized membrane protein
MAVLAAAFGAVIPPFQVADENAHFVRAYEISRGRWIGVNSPDLPLDVVRFIRRYPNALEEVRKLNADDDTAGLLSPAGGHYWMKRGIIGANIYCPTAYLPASLAIALARWGGGSPAVLLYVARFANALVFLAACYIALRLAPAYRLTISAIALLPTTLHQCAAVSADGMTISLSFVLVAYLLRFREHRATTAAKVGLAICFILLVLCKLSPWAFVALFTISPKSFVSRKAWLGYIACVAAAMLASVAAWHLASATNLEAFRAVRLADGWNMAAQTQYVLDHPTRVTGSTAIYIMKNCPRYLAAFAGGFGWTHFHLPMWVHLLTLLMLLTVASTETGGEPFSRTERLLWLIVFAAGVAFIHLALFVSQNLAGVQGRYFIPFSLFVLIPLRQPRLQIPPPALKRTVLGYSLIHGTVSLIWVAKVFYR